MMKKFLVASSLAVAGALLASCITNPIAPPGSGLLYSSTKANFNCLHDEDGSCVAATGSKAVGSKTGEACASSILNIIQTGDMSLKAAAANGGISEVNSVDYSSMSLLGSVFAKNCLVVNGK